MADQPTCPCRLCGKPTQMLGTKLCDFCWELERRIHRDPEIARRILNEMDAPAGVQEGRNG